MIHVVIDASVFVAAVESHDPRHAECRAALAAIDAQDITVHLPTIAPIEVACALARRTGNALASQRIAHQLFNVPRVTQHPIDSNLAAVAVQIGSTLGLRGADACYTALAVSLDVPLVTIDAEMIARGGGVLPGVWLAGAMGR